ncbi:MAG: TolC family protein [Alphaproteobacteria bacterium]|nr:TolC family protein [Alphaproteobacteria bacterium]
MKKFLVYLLALGFCVSANAMDLSLNDTVTLIKTESHDLKKANANIRKAKAGLDAVNSNRWFKLDATATQTRIINVEDPGKPMGFALPADIVGLAQANGVPPGMIPGFIEFPSNIGMAGLSLSQPIYTFGKIGHAADAARNAIRMAESGHDITRREVAAAAAQIYWTAKMTDEMVKIAEKNLKSSTDAKRQLERAGRANRPNLIKIQADIAAKEIALSDAQFNRDSAHRLLKVLAGIEAEANLVLTDEFPETFLILDAPTVLGSNPEWDLLDLNARMYESQSKARRAARYPVLAATGSYNYIMMHNDYKVWNGESNQSAVVGLALSVPIWDGLSARANATMDAMSAEQARQDLDKSKKMKSNEYRDAVLRHEHLRANLSKLKEARDLAGRTAQISADRFAAGQTSAVELADVQAALAQMDLALLNAKFNILMAEENVKKLNK